jgi:Fe-S cluster assembly iron-binding protein IscA
MLALTQDAAEVIRNIVDTSEEELPPDTGLRITTESVDEEGAELAITVVEGPESGDEKVVEHGATVYLSETASQLLEDKVLDAHAHEEHVHFTIGDQGAPLDGHVH